MDSTEQADAAFVGALDEYRLPSVSLAGRLLAFTVEADAASSAPSAFDLELDVVDDVTISWRSAGLDVPEWASDPYDAVHVRDGVVFLAIRVAHRQYDAVTVMWDETTGRAILVHSWIEPEHVAGRPRVSQSYHSASIDGIELSGETPGPTRDLIGIRNLYRYGPGVLYEHVYLNSERYAWQCLAGGEPGLGDVDLSVQWKLGQGLYLFAFREFGIDVATVWLHDLGKAKKTTGAFLARGSKGEATHGQGGGDIIPLGRVVYPDTQPI